MSELLVFSVVIWWYLIYAHDMETRGGRKNRHSYTHARTHSYTPVDWACKYYWLSREQYTPIYGSSIVVVVV